MRADDDDLLRRVEICDICLGDCRARDGFVIICVRETQEAV